MVAAADAASEAVAKRLRSIARKKLADDHDRTDSTSNNVPAEQDKVHSLTHIILQKLCLH